MERATHDRLIERLRRGERMASPPFEVAAAQYRAQAYFDRERSMDALPRIATASSAIAPGAVAPFEHAILARDAGGTLRAFANRCRHRATRLVDAPCAAKAMVCPYHGWTYDLA